MTRASAYKPPIGVHESAELLKITNKFTIIWVFISILLMIFLGFIHLHFNITEIYIFTNYFFTRRIDALLLESAVSVYFYIGSIYTFFIMTPIVTFFTCIYYYRFVIKKSSYAYFGLDDFVIIIFYILVCLSTAYIILFSKVIFDEYMGMKVIFLFPINIALGVGAIMLASGAIFFAVASFMKFLFQNGTKSYE